MGSGLGDVDEPVEFQGDGGANGLSSTQANMTPPHALGPIRQSVNGSTDRMVRASIGQFLNPAAIAQFMASLFEGGPGHVRLLDPGAGAERGPGLWPIACKEWFKTRRCREAFYLYAIVNAAASPRLYLVRNPAENLEQEEKLDVVRYVAGAEEIKTKGEMTS
jgi:hypothetical protein